MSKNGIARTTEAMSMNFGQNSEVKFYDVEDHYCATACFDKLQILTRCYLH